MRNGKTKKAKPRSILRHYKEKDSRKRRMLFVEEAGLGRGGDRGWFAAGDANYAEHR